MFPRHPSHNYTTGGQEQWLHRAHMLGKAGRAHPPFYHWQAWSCSAAAQEAAATMYQRLQRIFEIGTQVDPQVNSERRAASSEPPRALADTEARPDARQAQDRAAARQRCLRRRPIGIRTHRSLRAGATRGSSRRNPRLIVCKGSSTTRNRLSGAHWAPEDPPRRRR